jgi:hypothetical protein
VIARCCGALADRDPSALIEVVDYYGGVGHLCFPDNALEDAGVLEASWPK